MLTNMLTIVSTKCWLNSGSTVSAYSKFFSPTYFSVAVRSETQFTYSEAERLKHWSKKNRMKPTINGDIQR